MVTQKFPQEETEAAGISPKKLASRIKFSAKNLDSSRIKCHNSRQLQQKATRQYEWHDRLTSSRVWL